MLRATTALAILALLGGCPGNGPDASDAGPDASVDHDAATGGGLSFEFTTDPSLPGNVGTRVVVDEVSVYWHEVRAIGDSAPGDFRTSRAELPLEWHNGEDPDPLVFPLAPPGLYSRLEARMGGSERAYEIRGMATLTGGSTLPFRIREEALGSVSVSLTGLSVGVTPVTARITMSLSFLSSIDWDAAGTEDGEIRIEPGHPLLPAISAALATSFQLSGVN